MGKIIHNVISAFFKTFVPIVYVTFILAGLASALVSAVVEYNVFSELFKVSKTGSLFLSVPFLVVFAFESTKIFLIFLHKQYSISGNSAYISDKKTFYGLRIVLILISVVATLIFSFYNLQSPEYDQQLVKAKDEMQQQYKFELEKLNASFDQQINTQVESINESIALYEGRMITEEKHKFKGSRQEYRGPRFREAKKNKEALEERRTLLINTINNQRRLAIIDLNKDRDLRVDSIEGELTTFQKAGNKMLLATLKIINLKNNFPEWQYVIIVGFLSLMLSIGLEFIIWSSFTVLAIHHGDIFDFGITAQKYKNAAEAEVDISETEAEGMVKKAKRQAEVMVKGLKRQAKESVSKMKNKL